MCGPRSILRHLHLERVGWSESASRSKACMLSAISLNTSLEELVFNDDNQSLACGEAASDVVIAQGLAVATAVGESLRNPACRLKTLNLSNSRLGSGVVIIAEALQRNATVRYLKLTNNAAGVEGGTALGQMLRANTTLQRIDLVYNMLADGVIPIIEALGQERNAVYDLDLYNNKITPAGVEVMLRYLATPLASCNHCAWGPSLCHWGRFWARWEAYGVAR